MCAIVSSVPACFSNAVNASARPAGVAHCGLTQAPSHAPVAGGCGPRVVTTAGLWPGGTAGGEVAIARCAGEPPPPRPEHAVPVSNSPTTTTIAVALIDPPQLVAGLYLDRRHAERPA